MFGSLLLHPSTAPAIWRAWAHAGSQPARRSFALDAIDTEDGPVPLVWSETPLSPFVTLSEVARADAPPERQVLIAPPLAGGFPFILREVVERLALGARVAVLEWINARFAPSAAGGFSLDDQTAAIIEALSLLGPRTHLLALCQAGPSALTAAAVVARESAGPLSVSLIATPIDPMAAPSFMSRRIRDQDLNLYRAQLQPRLTPDGGERLVYPAESQFALFLATLAAQSPERDEFSRLILDSVADDSPPEASFLERASSFMDLPGALFLDALSRIYLSPSGPAAGLSWRGEALDPKVLAATPILAVEGGRDIVVAPGQARAALDYAPSDGTAFRRAHLAPENGHFGLFNGAGWRELTAPWVEAAVDEAERASD